MIRVFIKDKEWHKKDRVVLEDEFDNFVISFECKSSILGSKVCAYDINHEELYFIDEDVTSEFNEFAIHKETATIATLKRSNNVLYREIAIEAKNGKYDYLLLHGILFKSKNKIAKMKLLNNGGIKIELFDDNDLGYILTMLYTILLLLSR